MLVQFWVTELNPGVWKNTVNIFAYVFRVYSFMYVIKYIIVNDCFCHLCGVILTLKNSGCDILIMSWPENQGILFFYISQTFQMNRVSFMASHLNAVL